MTYRTTKRQNGIARTSATDAGSVRSTSLPVPAERMRKAVGSKSLHQGGGAYLFVARLKTFDH